MGLILDTNFVIEIEREARRRTRGAADAFLEAHLDESFYLTFTIAGELACGGTASRQSDWENLLRPYQVIPWSREVSWRYGEVFRSLALQGKLIGTNDLWIAATALVHGHGVVTRNGDEFARVPGLKVLSF